MGPGLAPPAPARRRAPEPGDVARRLAAVALLAVATTTLSLRHVNGRRVATAVIPQRRPERAAPLRGLVVRVDVVAGRPPADRRAEIILRPVLYPLVLRGRAPRRRRLSSRVEYILLFAVRRACVTRAIAAEPMRCAVRTHWLRRALVTRVRTNECVTRINGNNGCRRRNPRAQEARGSIASDLALAYGQNPSHLA